MSLKENTLLINQKMVYSSKMLTFEDLSAASGLFSSGLLRPNLKIKSETVSLFLLKSQFRHCIIVFVFVCEAIFSTYSFAKLRRCFLSGTCFLMIDASFPHKQRALLLLRPQVERREADTSRAGAASAEPPPEDRKQDKIVTNHK